MAYKKIVRKNDGTIMLDLTQDTVKESFVKEGMTFHDSNGESKIGTFAPQEKTVTENGAVAPDKGKYLSKVIVNVVGGGGSGSGIVDVTELPTENINTEAIYRIAEEVNKEPEVYLYASGAAYTMEEYLTIMASQQFPNASVSIAYFEVDELPETMKPSIISETVIDYNIYILKSNGYVYLSQTGSSADAQESPTNGYIDDIAMATEQGFYVVRGEVYSIYHYWRYDGAVWSEFISMIEVSKLPTENIQRNACYALMDIGEVIVYQYEDGELVSLNDMVPSNITITYHLIDTLPETIPPRSSTDIYVIKETGAAYLCDEIDEGVIGFVSFAEMMELPERGWVEDPATITEDGMYAYASSRIRGYFVYDGQWIEYIVPKGELVISENGTYDIANYASMVVNAAGELQEKTITSFKAEVLPDEGYDGFSKVTVDVNSAFQEKTITPTKAVQTVVADNGYNALSKVNVEAIPNNYVIVEGTLNVTANGSYDVANYIDMNVEIGEKRPEIEAALVTKTIVTYENSTITYIGNNAFADCSALTEINLPAVATIGNSAFKGCSALPEINLPVVAKIGEYAFADCSTLTEINLPVATIIGASAFNNCFSLISVNLPMVKTITNCVFSACHALAAINAPVATTIADWAFASCWSLTSVNLSAVTKIGELAFAYCSALTEINLPVVANIPANAFVNCSSLTSVNVPVATYIGSSAFRSCTSLTEINLPAVKGINWSAFTGCTSLTEINLPAVEAIWNLAFTGCYNLSSIILGNSSMCTLYNSNAFKATPYAGYSASFSGTPYIYVPASLVDAYKSANAWRYFASYFSAIEDMPTTES